MTPQKCTISPKSLYDRHKSFMISKGYGMQSVVGYSTIIYRVNHLWPERKIIETPRNLKKSSKTRTVKQEVIKNECKKDEQKKELPIEVKNFLDEAIVRLENIQDQINKKIFWERLENFLRRFGMILWIIYVLFFIVNYIFILLNK